MFNIRAFIATDTRLFSKPAKVTFLLHEFLVLNHLYTLVCELFLSINLKGPFYFRSCFE